MQELRVFLKFMGFDAVKIIFHSVIPRIGENFTFSITNPNLGPFCISKVTGVFHFERTNSIDIFCDGLPIDSLPVSMFKDLKSSLIESGWKIHTE